MVAGRPRYRPVMADLAGRRAIVTGGGQGVGQGIALALASAGAAVVVAGRTERRLQRTVDEIERRGGRGAAVVADVTDTADLDRLVEDALARLGGIDILVNNANQSPLGRLLDVTGDAFETGFRAGPLATLRLMQRCHPHLVAAGGGVIVNLGSGSALRRDPVGVGCYAAVKDAVRVLSRAAACEWGPDGIRVVTVVPLAMSPGMRWWSEHEPERFAEVVAEVPLGHIGDCERDVGEAVAWVCSDGARYVTGSTLMLDGGQAYLR
jgi:meso-butanediol dehydrogenase / (S,S)-butanediol dehydrogenase / diacetyl reductase